MYAAFLAGASPLMHSPNQVRHPWWLKCMHLSSGEVVYIDHFQALNSGWELDPRCSKVTVDSFWNLNRSWEVKEPLSPSFFLSSWSWNHWSENTACQLFFLTVHRLKEELIRDLVKNSRAAKQLNEAYLSKIQKLERVNYLRNFLFTVVCDVVQCATRVQNIWRS